MPNILRPLCRSSQVSSHERKLQRFLETPLSRLRAYCRSVLRTCSRGHRKHENDVLREKALRREPNSYEKETLNKRHGLIEAGILVSGEISSWRRGRGPR